MTRVYGPEVLSDKSPTTTFDALIGLTIMALHPYTDVSEADFRNIKVFTAQHRDAYGKSCDGVRLMAAVYFTDQILHAPRPKTPTRSKRLPVHPPDNQIYQALRAASPTKSDFKPSPKDSATRKLNNMLTENYWNYLHEPHRDHPIIGMALQKVATAAVPPTPALQPSLAQKYWAAALSALQRVRTAVSRACEGAQRS